MQDKKLIAFDLFDTCMEFTITKPQENQEYDKLFANLGILERKREIQKILLTTNRDIENIIKDMIPGTNIDDFLKIYYQHIKKELASVELFPETKNTLSKIRDKGYKIAVISNISKPYTQALYRLLPYIFDYEVLSCNVGSYKPDKKIFECLKNISGYDSDEILMIGDNMRSDIQGADKAGIDAIHLDRSFEGIVYCKNNTISISTLTGALDMI